jgi:hypothetical protein
MAGTGHKSILPGQRAMVHLHDGTRFVDRFLEDKDWAIVFEQRGTIPARLVRSVCRYRMDEAGDYAGESVKRTCYLCGNTYQAREAAKMVLVTGRTICRGCARLIAEQL